MIRQALILPGGAPDRPAADAAALARLAGEASRHGLAPVLSVSDLVPQAGERAFVLEAGEVRDINLWDLALAADGGSALAVTPGGASAGAALLDVEALRRMPKGGDPFETITGLPRLARRVYDRPVLNLGADIVRGAVIFDRDGVINEDTEYPHLPEHIVWTATGKAAVKAVNDAGLYAFVATNQSGVARGMYSEQSVVDLHAWMQGELNAAGAHIDAFEYSPFHPEGAVEAYRRDSDCRKPGPGMLNRVMAAHPVDRARTVMIGDRPGDVAAAQAAGIEGLLFEGGDVAAFLAPVIARLAG